MEQRVTQPGWQFRVLDASTERDLDDGFTTLGRAAGRCAPRHHRRHVLHNQRNQLVALAAAMPFRRSISVREYRRGRRADELRDELQRCVPPGRQSMPAAFSRARKPADLPVMQPTKFELVINLQDRQGARSRHSRQRCSPAPTRSSNETARVHHAARRRGGVAARGARAAAERMRRIGVLIALAADDPEGQARVCGVPCRVCRSWAGSMAATCGIDIRWACRRCRPHAQHAAELVALCAGRHPGLWRHGRGAVAAGDPHRADRVHAGRRSGRCRLRRELGAAGRQRHRVSRMFEYGISGEMAGVAQGDRAARDARRSSSGPRLPAGIGQFGAIQAVAPSFGVELSPVNVRDAGEIERAVAAFARELEWRPDRDCERVRQSFIAN